MLDIVGNHATPTDGNYSAIKPFNKPEHYHSCSGCTEHCSIPDAAYASAEAWPPRMPDAQLVQQCRLVNLADLNQTHPYVRQGLIKWVKDTLKKYPFDAIRMDTVKHVETVSAETALEGAAWIRGGLACLRHVEVPNAEVTGQEALSVCWGRRAAGCCSMGRSLHT